MDGFANRQYKYRIAWLPGDGVGVDDLDATRIVLDKLALDAEYIHGDILRPNDNRSAVSSRFYPIGLLSY